MTISITRFKTLGRIRQRCRRAHRQRDTGGYTPSSLRSLDYWEASPYPEALALEACGRKYTKRLESHRPPIPRNHKKALEDELARRRQSQSSVQPEESLAGPAYGQPQGPRSPNRDYQVGIADGNGNGVGRDYMAQNPGDYPGE